MSQVVPPLIDTQTMVARVRDYGLSTTNQVVTMMMSGVFATSALAIADIMRTPDDFWVRLTLWTSATVAAILVMTRQLHGNSLIVHPSPWHVPTQLAVGFLVASGFAFIPLSTGGVDGWRLVYFVQLLSGMAAYVSASLLMKNTLPEFFSSDFRAIIKRHVETNERGRRRIPIYLLFIGAAAAAAWMSKSSPDPWMQVLVGFNVLFAFLSIALLASELRYFRSLLDDIEAVRVAALTSGHGEEPLGQTILVGAPLASGQ